MEKTKQQTRKNITTNNLADLYHYLMHMKIKVTQEGDVKIALGE